MEFKKDGFKWVRVENTYQNLFYHNMYSIYGKWHTLRKTRDSAESSMQIGLGLMFFLVGIAQDFVFRM